MNRQGAVGALLDIYEHTISDLKNVIKDISDNDLTKILDLFTKSRLFIDKRDFFYNIISTKVVF